KNPLSPCRCAVEISMVHSNKQRGKGNRQIQWTVSSALLRLDLQERGQGIPQASLCSGDKSPNSRQTPRGEGSTLRALGFVLCCESVCACVCVCLCVCVCVRC